MLGDLKGTHLISPFEITARSCGQPPDPAYGWHAGECYTYGCKITYNCGTGYELVGKHERYCQSDGSWTPKELPTCVCEYCGDACRACNRTSDLSKRIAQT